MAVNNNQLDHHNTTGGGDKLTQGTSTATTATSTMSALCPPVTHSRARTSTIINTSLSPTPPVAELTANFSEENYTSKSGNSKCRPHQRLRSSITSNTKSNKPTGDTLPADVDDIGRPSQSGNNKFNGGNDPYDDDNDVEEDEDDEDTLDEDTFPDMLRVKSEEYSKRIAKLQEEYLIPLKEDLADWINRITESTFQLTPENFMDKLDNGVIICKLAKLIESQVDLHSYTPITATTTATVNANCNVTSTATTLPSKITEKTASPEASSLQSQLASCNPSTAVTTLPSDLLDVKQVPINDISNGHLDIAVNGGHGGDAVGADDSCFQISSSSSIQKKKQQESMAAVAVVDDEVNANGNKEVSNINFLFNTN